MSKFILLPMILFFCSVGLASTHVRKILLKDDEILQIKAALGIATIIQLPEAIQSAIIGDQSGFKVEYLDRAITIKSLRWGVKTNLYLVTEKRRYNIKLITGAQELADYVVYVLHSEVSQETKWTPVGISKESSEYKLSLVKVGISSHGFILIEAKLSTSSGQSFLIKPEDFWIMQGVVSKTINGLFLSGTKLTKEKSIVIGISIAKSDLTAKKTIVFEIRNQRTLSLNVPESLLWK